MNRKDKLLGILIGAAIGACAGFVGSGVMLAWAASTDFDDIVTVIATSNSPALYVSNLDTDTLNGTVSIDAVNTHTGIGALTVSSAGGSANNYAINAANTSTGNESYAGHFTENDSTNAALFTMALDIDEFSVAPDDPASGKGRIYALDDQTLHYVDSLGTDIDLTAAGGGGMTSWTLSGDSGTDQTVNDGETVEINGDTSGIDCVAGATNKITVSFDPSEITTYAAPSSFNITVNSANPKRSIMLPANVWYATTTAGATGMFTSEMATNKQNIAYWQFVPTSSDPNNRTYIETMIVMPDNWDGGNCYATIGWSPNSTGTESVRWAIQGCAYSDGEDFDQAWGTAVGVTDTEQNSSTKLHVTAETAAITFGGTSPAAGDMVELRLYRDPDHAGDTDTGLLGETIQWVKLEYSTGAYSE